MIIKDIKLVREKILKRDDDITIATNIALCPHCGKAAVWVGCEYTFLYIACTHCHGIYEVVMEPKIP